MKNFKLLLATAVVFAVGSAFTAAEKNAVAGEYVLIDGVYQIKTDRPEGLCVQASETCDYTKINPSGNNTNPANFQPFQAGRWEE